MGFNSRWGSIVSIFVFDWGSINIFMGWGCNQEWGSNRADTVHEVELHWHLRGILRYIELSSFSVLKIRPPKCPLLRGFNVLSSQPALYNTVPNAVSASRIRGSLCTGG